MPETLQCVDTTHVDTLAPREGLSGQPGGTFSELPLGRPAYEDAVQLVPKPRLPHTWVGLQPVLCHERRREPVTSQVVQTRPAAPVRCGRIADDVGRHREQ